MHTAVPRQAQPPAVKLPASFSSIPPALPGLISSLRPIRKNTTQLADEAALLRRFMYKHKNQHKGQRWWKRIVEVDRCASRAWAELSSWLALFGMSPDNEEHSALGPEELCRGFLAVPRVLLIVEKNVQVLLNCAGILDQLVDSRAFLAFALVVVALAARLHTLFSVLYQDLDRAAVTLLALIEANKLTEVVKPHLARLPRDLRRFIPSNAAPRPDQPELASGSATPVQTSISSADDLGSVVARRPLVTSQPGSARSSTAASSAPSSRQVSRTASPAALSTLPTNPTRVSDTSPVATARPDVGTGEIVERKKKRLQDDARGDSDVVPRKRESPGPSIPVAERTSKKKRMRTDLDAGESARAAPTQAGSLASVTDPSAPRTTAKKGLLDLEQSLETFSMGPVKRKKEKKVKKRRRSGAGDEIDAIFG
ncbi:hypothetical protein JCM10908_004665 [Rhodotorula pacifica]|uniref:uncharacterized protein n=1 Tax=Rhodotorula pacifica TaxID=1495444 RepID=UPI00317E01C9